MDRDSHLLKESCTSNRTSVETQLGAENACLIPKSLSSKGEKSFIRTLLNEKELKVNIGLKTVDTLHNIQVQALLDSGANGIFIDKKFVEVAGMIEILNIQSECSMWMEPQTKEDQ